MDMKIIHTIYKQILIIFLCLAMLMYLLLGLGGTGHTVLCYSDDCQISVEEVLNDKCIDCCVAPYETNSISSLYEAITSNSYDSGCCLFIPILKVNLTGLLVSTQCNLMPTQIAVSLDLPEFPLINFERLSSVHITTLNPTLSSLRTVKILI